MLTLPTSPEQILTIYRPTSSTISFTVSTCPQRRTLTSQLFFYSRILLRIVLGVSTLLLLWAKWRLVFPLNQEDPDIWAPVSVLLLDSVVGQAAQYLAARLQWRYLIPGALALLIICVRRGYTEESLLILRGLGVQTSTSSPTYLSTATTRFIPTTSIQDIFIHEAFKGFEVRFYLAIVVSGEEDVVVVFPNLLPKRKILEEVWRGARSGLWEAGNKSKT